MSVLRRLLIFVLLSSTSCLCVGQQAQAFRFWTTSNGKRSGTRLKYIEAKGDFVRLQRQDNDKLITMKLSGLSEADQAYVKRQTDAKPMPEPTSSISSAGSGNGAGDWPQWRGPNRDGKSPATGLMQQWPGGGPETVWNITGLGEGYSTPAVTSDMIYVLGAQGNDEFIFALSVSDGSQQWKTRIGNKKTGNGYEGPKGTPTIDGDKIYALGSDGDLVCVSRSNGDSVWSKNLRSDFGGQIGSWDYAESPLIDGNKLICTPGGSGSTIVALEKGDGRKIWSSPVGRFTNDGFARAAYASTIAASIRGTRQYIAFLHGGVVGVDANSGTPLWHYDSPANGTANCSTPVVQGDSIFAASGYGTGGGRANLMRSGRNWNVNEAFFNNKMQNHHGGFVLHDGHIYGTNDSVLMCLDWNTGNIKWQDRCVGKGSVTFADGHLYVRGEGGDVALVEATPSGFKEKGRFSQSDRSGKPAWAHPVVASGRLYIHDQDRLLCFSLK